MKRFFIFFGAVSLGLTAYLVLSSPDSGQPAADPVDEAGNQIGGWGTKQRVSGTGDSLLGKLKQTVGDVADRPDLSTGGTLDQVKGTVKDTAGKAAQAVENAIHDLNG